MEIKDFGIQPHLRTGEYGNLPPSYNSTIYVETQLLDSITEVINFQTSISSHIWYLLEGRRGVIKRRNGVGCRYGGVQLYLFLRSFTRLLTSSSRKSLGSYLLLQCSNFYSLLPFLSNDLPQIYLIQDNLERTLSVLKKIRILILLTLTLHSIISKYGNTVLLLFIWWFLGSSLFHATVYLWRIHLLCVVHIFWSFMSENGKMMIYQIQSHPERFITMFRKRSHNTIVFETVTSLACACYTESQIKKIWTVFKFRRFLKDSFRNL